MLLFFLQMARSLVAFRGWSSVRDRTNRKHCSSHEKYARIRGMVVDEGGHSTGVLLYRINYMCKLCLSMGTFSILTIDAFINLHGVIAEQKVNKAKDLHQLHDLLNFT